MLIIFANSVEFKSVIEVTLGYKSAWNSWLIIRKFFFTDTFFLVLPEILDLDDGIAVGELVNFEVLSSKLLIVSRLDISSMVLVEVVELIVYIDRSTNFVLYEVEIKFALFLFTICSNLLYISVAILIVSLRKFDDLVAHNVEDHTNGQEDYTKYTKGEHSAHGCRHWSPSGKCLLLKLRLL